MSEKIIDKIRKLLRRAADPASSEAEINKALAAAHRLMAQHNVDESQLDDAPGVNETHVQYAESQAQDWCRQLMAILARFHMCSVINQKYKGAAELTFVVVGSDGNRAVVVELYYWISKKFSKRTPWRWRKHVYDTEAEYNNGYTYSALVDLGEAVNRSTWLKSYLMGVLSGLQEAYEQSEKEAIEDNDQYGLVLSTNSLAVRDYMVEKYGNLPTSRTRTERVDPNAFYIGHEDGVKHKEI